MGQTPINADHAASLIALSDERDKWHARVQQAWRDGYSQATRDHADDYNIGFIDGVLARKHVQHDIVEMAELDCLRWGPGGREHFGDDRDGDYRGGPLPYPDDHPGPEWVHLGGPVVHHHPCQPVCYAHKPGWYRLGDAITILSRLPGNYADAIADLRDRAARLEGSAAA